MKPCFLLMLAWILLATACGGKGVKQPQAAGSSSISAMDSAPDSSLTSTAHTSPESSRIPDSFAGVWVEDKARTAEQGADYEAAITICEGGRASYAVYSNQLFIDLTVTHRDSPEGDILSFYYKGMDAGRGFANANIQRPEDGALAATAMIVEDGGMRFNWQAGKGWIESLREAGPRGEDRVIFPPVFYRNTVAMAGLCEETE